MNTIIFTIQLCFVDTAAMIADGFCDWNLVKHVIPVSILCTVYKNSITNAVSKNNTMSSL